MLDNGMLMAKKEAFLQCRGKCLGQGKETLAIDNAINPPRKDILLPHSGDCLGQAKECWSKAMTSFLTVWDNHIPAHSDQKHWNACAT